MGLEVTLNSPSTVLWLTLGWDLGFRVSGSDQVQVSSGSGSRSGSVSGSGSRSGSGSGSGSGSRSRSGFRCKNSFHNHENHQIPNYPLRIVKLGSQV